MQRDGRTMYFSIARLIIFRYNFSAFSKLQISQSCNEFAIVCSNKKKIHKARGNQSQTASNFKLYQIGPLSLFSITSASRIMYTYLRTI